MLLTCFRYRLNAANGVIQVGGGRTKFLLTALAVNTLSKVWNPLFTMSSGVMNDYIRLGLGTVIAAWAAKADSDIRILSAL